MLLRVELELPSGLTLRARMTKEEYAFHNLAEGMPVSFQIRQYRVLGGDTGELRAEVAAVHDTTVAMGEGI